MSITNIPQPIRNSRGATDVGPRNLELDQQNPDVLAAPDTDHGSIPNLKFPFGLAHNRLEDGGWAREVTVRELPAAKAMAGVTMRLDYQAGDVGYVPRTLGHYIENTGSTRARFLNVFNLATFQDISLNQWMALSPPELVQGHLNLDETAMKALRRETRTVVR